MHSYNIEIFKDLYDLNLLRDDPAPSHSQYDESGYLRQEGMDQRLSQHDPYAVYSKKISSFDEQYANIIPIISSPEATIEQKKEELQKLIGLEKEIAIIIKANTDDKGRIDKANANIKVLENLERMSYLVPTIASINLNTYWSIGYTLTSNFWGICINIRTLMSFYYSTTKHDFLEIISSDLFMHILIHAYG